MPMKAETAWRNLNGIICVYKPSTVSCFYVMNKLQTVICDGLNKLETRPLKKYLEVNRTAEGISLNVRPSYADNVLVCGPRYQPEIVGINFVSRLSNFTSGTMIVGINEGQQIVKALQESCITKCYHLKGILGQATTKFSINDKVIARAKYDHVNKNFVDRVLTSYQGYSQRKIFEDYGLHLSSEEAYEFAISKMYRPSFKGGAIAYSLKSIDVNPPHITIEIQCINENEDYLKSLIHNLGVSLKSYATCSEIRCIRQGCFNTEHALLLKHWNLENILDNMKLCHETLLKNFPNSIKYIPTVSAENVEENVEV